MVKGKCVDVSVPEPMDNLFNAFKDRMNTLPGWSVDLPLWLKSANPELYDKWTEAEYLLDERWGLNDLEGFKIALSQYEEICLKILVAYRQYKSGRI
jgi:hypothetical protein